MPVPTTLRGARRHGFALLDLLPQACLDFAEIARLDSKFRLAPMATTEGRIITVGVTGASGAVYAQAVLRLLDADGRVERVFLVASDAGLRLLATELGVVAADAKKLPSLLDGQPLRRKFEYLPNKDIGASIASGSALRGRDGRGSVLGGRARLDCGGHRRAIC